MQPRPGNAGVRLGYPAHERKLRVMPKLQLQPLSKRLNPNDMAKRAMKIAARRTIAEQLTRGMNGVAYEVIRMRKRQTFHVRCLYALIVVLFALLGYHVHIH